MLRLSHYSTGEDVGTTVTDMAILQQHTRHVLGTPDSSGSSGDPSPSTALGCFYGIKETVRERFGDANLDGMKIAVQGLGNVGWPLCDLLNREGAHLHVCDIRSDVVQWAVDQFDSRPVSQAR